MTAQNIEFWARVQTEEAEQAGMDYEHLCQRFPVQRINDAIRNRILRNQARRTLAIPQEAISC